MHIAHCSLAHEHAYQNYCSPEVKLYNFLGNGCAASPYPSPIGRQQPLPTLHLLWPFASVKFIPGYGPEIAFKCLLLQETLK